MDQDFVSLQEVHDKIKHGLESNTQAEKFCEIKDFDNIFRYNKIIDPSGRLTNKWNLFVKKENMESWNLISSMLSNEYTVCKTQAALHTIKKQLGGNIIGEFNRQQGSYVDCSFTLEGYQIQHSEDHDINRLLFNLLTGLDIDVQEQKYMLSFNLVNSLVGTHSLCLNYGFVTKLEGTKEKISKAIVVNNKYVLNEYQSTIIHNKKLKINYAEVENVKESISQRIDLYKKTNVTKEFLDKFKENFLKRITKKVDALWEELPNDMRNFYYFSFITSFVAQQESRIDFDISSRRFISEYVRKYSAEPKNKII